MLRLTNIQKNNDIIKCDAYPEDSKESGELAVNYKSGKIIESHTPEGYDWCDYHLNVHGRKALLEIAEQEKIPEEKILMWY